MTQPFAFAYSTIPAKILFEGAQELLGRDNFKRLMDTSYPMYSPVHMADDGSDHKHGLQTNRFQTEQILYAGFQADAFLQALEECYGIQSGRGLALRIGRVVFKNALKQYGDSTGLQCVEFRLQPAPQRFRNGLQILAQLFIEQFGDDVQVREQSTHWEWHSRRCPADCAAGSEPCCYLMVGFLQEFMTWAGAGRFYRVTETQCQASGEPGCVFRIDKKALD